MTLFGMWILNGHSKKIFFASTFLFVLTRWKEYARRSHPHIKREPLPLWDVRWIAACKADEESPAGTWHGRCCPMRDRWTPREWVCCLWWEERLLLWEFAWTSSFLDWTLEVKKLFCRLSSPTPSIPPPWCGSQWPLLCLSGNVDLVRRRDVYLSIYLSIYVSINLSPSLSFLISAV